SSSTTRPCIWPERPTAAGSARSSRTVRSAARTQSSGSCSAQPGLGVESGYEASAAARTAPSGVMAIALTPDVPTSSPTIVSAGMQVQELAPGLWRWTAFYPEWKDVVGSVYYETADAVVL